MNPATASLDEIRAWVGERMKGSPEPVELHVTSCYCPEHRKLPGEGSFCEACIGSAAVAQGFGPTCFETRDVHELFTMPRWCDACGVPIVGKLDEGETGDELDHWLAANHHAPSTPEEWREFSLCLVEPTAEQRTSIRAVIARALTAGVTS